MNYIYIISIMAIMSNYPPQFKGTNLKFQDRIYILKAQRLKRSKTDFYIFFFNCVSDFEK